MSYNHGLGKAVRTAAGIAALIAAAAVALSPAGVPHGAYAAGFLTLSSSQGHAGDQVELSGSGFVSGQVVRAYFSSDEAAIGHEIGVKVTSYELVGEARIGGGAAFESPIIMTVPSTLDDGATKKTVSSGDYHIYITYKTGNRIEASSKFYVPGPVQVTPGTGKIGTWLRIGATGLTPNTVAYAYFSSVKAGVGGTIGESVAVYQNAGMALVGTDGALSDLVFQVPDRLTDGKFAEDVHGGDYYLYLTYFTSRTVISTVTPFTVIAGEIRLAPAEGPVASEVKITGTGLRPNQEITIRYDGDITAIKSGEPKTDSDGSFNCTFAVPDSSTGGHAITASDVSGNQPEAWFTVKPTISAPPSVTRGGILGITGQGFGEAQEMTISINGQVVSTTPPIVTTNRRGAFTASLRVVAPVGTAIIAVSDAMRSSDEISVSVITAPAGSASLTVSPSTSGGNPGHVGMSLQLDGAGFKGSSPITLTLAGKEAAVPTSDASGTFRASFNVPVMAAGEHLITASDGDTTADAVFVMEARSPAPPVPLLPSVGSSVSKTVRFDWSDVSDDSGTTYALQVADDQGFSSILLDKKALSRSEYTLAAGEELAPAQRQDVYYWRVKAVDGAGNQSDWTTPARFTAGSSSPSLPAWSIYAMVGAGVVVLALAGAFWAMKRRQG